MSTPPVSRAPRSLLASNPQSIDRRLLSSALAGLGECLARAQRARGELEALRQYADDARRNSAAVPRGCLVESARMIRRSMFGKLADATAHLSIALDAVLADEGLSPDQVDTGLTGDEMDALARLSEALLVLSARVGEPL